MFGGEANKSEPQVSSETQLRHVRRQMIQSIKARLNERRTASERLADNVVRWFGSISFVIINVLLFVFWILVNLNFIPDIPVFDPYPFILLNLVLSTLAALQAPIIMMSQNRQESRDRLRSEHDYRINLKAELEIRHLHEKMDHLLSNQWRRLLEIQQMQTDIMEELVRRKR